MSHARRLAGLVIAKGGRNMPDKERLINYIIDEVLRFIKQDYRQNSLEISSEFYDSKTYRDLWNEEGLYLEDADYIYNLFKRECAGKGNGNGNIYG